MQYEIMVDLQKVFQGLKTFFKSPAVRRTFLSRLSMCRRYFKGYQWIEGFPEPIKDRCLPEVFHRRPARNIQRKDDLLEVLKNVLWKSGMDDGYSKGSIRVIEVTHPYIFYGYRSFSGSCSISSLDRPPYQDLLFIEDLLKVFYGLRDISQVGKTFLGSSMDGRSSQYILWIE